MYKILYKKGDLMKHGDIVRSIEGFMIGKVVKTDTECSIYSIEGDENRWVVRAHNLNELKRYWKVQHITDKEV